MLDDVTNSCVLVAVCLARCLLNEGARGSSEKQAITPVRYDEGTIATNHNAPTGERGYHSSILSRCQEDSVRTGLYCHIQYDTLLLLLL